MFDSIEETIRVGEEGSLPVNISHMNPASPEFWGEPAVKATEMIEGSRKNGVEITFDVTVWTRGGGPYLQMLPDWAQEGGFFSLKSRIEDPQTRKKIAYQLDNGLPDWKGWIYLEWDDQLICRTGKNKESLKVGKNKESLGYQNTCKTLHGLLKN